MRIAFLLIAAALCAPAGAQEGAQASSAQQEVQAFIEQVRADLKKAQAAFMVKFNAIESQEEKSRLVEAEYPRPEQYVGDVMALAEKYQGTAAAADALLWIVTDARDGSAIDPLLEDHFDHPKIGDICFWIQQFDRMREYEAEAAGEAFEPQAPDQLRRLYEASSRRDVKAAALYHRATSMREDKAINAAGKKLLQRVIVEYGDVARSAERPELGTYGEQAEADLFEADHLQVGHAAPDIVGQDLDGVEFKLSDYRGKVVMIDFWGDW